MSLTSFYFSSNLWESPDLAFLRDVFTIDMEHYLRRLSQDSFDILRKDIDRKYPTPQSKNSIDFVIPKPNSIDQVRDQFISHMTQAGSIKTPAKHEEIKKIFVEIYNKVFSASDAFSKFVEHKDTENSTSFSIVGKYMWVVTSGSVSMYSPHVANALGLKPHIFYRDNTKDIDGYITQEQSEAIMLSAVLNTKSQRKIVDPSVQGRMNYYAPLHKSFDDEGKYYPHN